MRSPKAIANDLRTLNDTASKAFVPVNLVKAMELSVEFAEATTAVLDAAGLLPAEEVPAEKPAA